MNLKKQSKTVYALVILTVLLAATAFALLSIYRDIDSSVKVKAIGLEVTPTAITWSDLVEGEASNQTVEILLNNTRNIDLNVTFSDNLATGGLSMEYPTAFILPAYNEVYKNITLVHDGSTPYGSYSWTITVTGEEA